MNTKETRPGISESHIWDRLPRPQVGVPAALAGAISTGFITVLCFAVRDWLPAHGVAMFYILSVVAAAVAFGLQAGIFTATTAFLAYNFFFLQPTFTFSIADPRDLVSLIVFFAVAAATGSLAGRLREVAEQARQRSRSLEVLNAFTMQLSAASRTEDVLKILWSEAERLTGTSALIMKVSNEGLRCELQSEGAIALGSADWQAAERSVSTRQTTYAAAPGWQGQQYEFRPLFFRGAPFGLLGIHQPEAGDALDAMLDTMLNQAAMAMERLSFEAEKNAAEKQAETERLRSAMLSSVSHDIKTPLASIKGAVTSLRELGPKMSEESRSDLLAAIEEESERLSRFVTNILDMMRFEANFSVACDWIDLVDTISVTAARARKLMPRAQISLSFPEAPAVIWGNETLVEHVMLNLIENSVGFSPDTATVRIAVRADADCYRVTVEDAGLGIAPGDLGRVFEKFFRGSEVKTRGSGLGLTICKEAMTAIGGTISAESPILPRGGTRITLTFPRRNAETQMVGVQ